jgi:hypothetical protein
MKSKTTRLAAAAAIIIAVMTGVNHFAGSTVGVVWASVVTNLEAAKTCVYRIRCSSEGVMPGASVAPRKPGTTEWVVYNSSKYGIRSDTYFEGYLGVTAYYPADMNMVTYVFHPPHRQYQRQHLDQQQRRFAREHLKDPRDILKDFMAFEHKKLGRRDINDVKAEGIEINDPRLLKARFPEGGGLESYVMRLWVDVKTNLPVRVETNCTYEGGSYRTAWTTDRLEWDPDLEASIFEPNIPADYTPQKHGYYYRGG